MRNDSKISLKELDSKYPTRTKQKASRRAMAYSRYKNKLELGSQGAASEVRRIDPSSLDLSKYGITVDTANTVVGDTNP